MRRVWRIRPPSAAREYRLPDSLRPRMRPAIARPVRCRAPTGESKFDPRETRCGPALWARYDRARLRGCRDAVPERAAARPRQPAWSTPARVRRSTYRAVRAISYDADLMRRRDQLARDGRRRRATILTVFHKDRKRDLFAGAPAVRREANEPCVRRRFRQLRRSGLAGD